MRAVFRIRDYRLLFIGMAASIVGDSLMLIVLAIWAKELTGADGAAGLVLMFVAAPMLLAPLSGWLVDRFRHRPFLVFANLANAVFLLPLMFVGGGPADLWLLCLVAGLLGVGTTLDAPAINGLLKKLLPVELLVDANGATQTVRQGIRLVGPLVGAGVYAAFGGFAVAIMDAVSFVIAAAAIAAMRIRESPPVRDRLDWRVQLSAGVRFIIQQAALRRALTGLGICGLGLGALEATVFALNDSGLGQRPEFTGVIIAASGVGGLIGGLAASLTVRRFGELGTQAIALFLLSTTFLLWTIPSVPVVLATAPLAGLALPLMVVADHTLVQRSAPQEVIGRVSGANEMLFSVPYTLSLGLGALLVTFLDYKILLVGIAACVASGAIWLYLGRRLTAPAVAVKIPV